MKDKKDFGKLVKEAGILFGITLLSGLLLGFVYELTKEPIAYQQALKQDRACREVFADASVFEELFLPEQTAGLTEADAYAKELGVSLYKIFGAYAENGALLGYVLDVASSEGYGGTIEMMVGIDNSGVLNGISLLGISETPGLGMRAGEVLVPQFANRQAAVFVYTKTGAAANNEIDAISGATVTTDAVVDAVNAGLYYFNTVLKEGGNGQ